MTRKKILVLCTANSCRSQIAHGYLQYLGKKNVDVFSAGVETKEVNLRAISVMKEDGIDISHHTSNHVNDFSHIAFDYVITVCDDAKENCPYLPAIIKNIHQDFPDPAKAKGSEEEIMQQFRNVRNQIRDFSARFITELGQ